MADKKISLKIAIDGEAAYRDSIKKINSENKTLNAEMKQLQAVYADSANSYDYLAKKGEILAKVQGELEKKTDDYRNLLTLTKMSLLEHRSATEELAEAAEKATSAYKEAKKETDTYKKALDAADDALASYKKQLIDSGESLSAHKDKITALKKAQLDAKDAYNISKNSTAELKKEMDSANASYARNASNIKYCEEHQELYGRQIIESETELIKLNREIDKNNTYLQEAATSFDGTAHSIDKYGNEVKDAAEDTKSFANAADLLAQAIVASGAVEGAEKLRDAIVDTAKASIEYESAFAGVRKTVDGTAEELAAISDGIKGMATEIPIATTELAGIAEAAGQLGIETGNILKFTDVTAKLAATTDLSANDAAVSISKLGNITKLTADEYSNFGSALVALGNNTSAFESEILAMAIRLASAGDIVGATNSQLLGIASTLVSVGVEAEAGGTAFSKLLRQIEVAVQTGSKKVQEYATVAGMSAEEFSSAWKNDAVGAVTAFIEGLGSLESKGQSSIVVLNEMGLTEQRLLDTISRLSEAEGMLSNNIALSNTAWEENTALANEAAIRFETTESKLQILNNTFNNLKITVGDELLDKFGGAIDGLTDLTQAADEYVKKNPDVVAGITAVAAGLGSLAVAGTVIPLITTLWGLLSANPVGLATAGILALAAASTTYYIASSDAVDAVSTFNRSLQETASQIDTTRESVIALKNAHDEETSAIQAEQSEIESAIQKIEELGNKTDLTASESEILKQSMDKLNGSIPGLRLSYDNLNDSLEETVYHLRLVASAQALVDEAVAKSDLRDSLEGNFEQLDKDVENAKKSLDDANTLLDRYIKLRDEYTAPAATGSGRARGMGSTYNPYDEDVKRLEKAVEDANALYGMAIGAREANKRKIYEIDAEIASLDSQYAEKAEEIKNTTTDLFTSTETGATTAAEAVEEASDKIAVSTEKIGKSAASTKVTVDEAGKAIITHADTVKKNLETLSKEYDSAYKSARSSLDGMGGAFESLVFTSDKSVGEMQSNLRTQADYFTGTLNNINNAVRVGFNKDLVSSLAAGGKETQGYLQTIMDEFTKLAIKYGENSEEAQNFVDSFNEDFERTSLAKDALAQTMAGMQTNFEERKGDILAQASDLVTELEGYTGNAYDEVSAAVTKVVGNVSDTLGKIELAIAESSVKAGTAMQTMRQTVDANLEGTADKGREAGENYTVGLAEGIENGTSAVDKAIKRLVDDAIVGAVNNRLEIRSPSRVGMEQGKFYDEGIAQGIERNESTVISANLKMISDLEARSQSAAAAAGKSLGDTMVKSMTDALKAGQALRQAAESGNLTVNGNKVQTAAQAGIPSLSGQAALDWNAEQKRDFGLPDDWSNQDIVDWLNGGGAQSGGMSSTTKANIESAVKNESTGSHLITVNRTGGYGKVTKHDPEWRSKLNSTGSVVINQTFNGNTSAYQAGKAVEKAGSDLVNKYF